MDTDFLILADGAQVVGEKLYLLGGAWTTLAVRQFPIHHQLSVAVGVVVEWSEADKQHRFALDVMSDDDGRILGELEGEFQTGRPAVTSSAGIAHQFLMAANVPVVIEKPGRYVVRLTLDGQIARRKQFLVTGPPLPPAVPPTTPNL